MIVPIFIHYLYYIFVEINIKWFTTNVVCLLVNEIIIFNSLRVKVNKIITLIKILRYYHISDKFHTNKRQLNTQRFLQFPDTHRPQQSGQREARGADARPERAHLEHFSVDELSTAAGDVHRVAVVHALRAQRTGAPAAGPGARAAEGPAPGH